MTKSWKKYQIDTANFFRKLGFNVFEEYEVNGARATHSVDVYVEGQLYGIQFIWIVECKDWKTSIPKEKVMALASIVSDIGADRGFLLSEIGFQSGAIRAVRNTNITLSSIADLNEDLQVEAIIGNMNWRLQKEKIRLRKMKKAHFADHFFPPMSSVLGELMVLESVLEDALEDKYPFYYKTDVIVNSLEHLVQMAEPILKKAEEWQLPTNFDINMS